MLNDLRRRVLANEPVSTEELSAAIATLRKNRTAAMSAKATKGKTKDAAAAADLDNLLGDLGL